MKRFISIIAFAVLSVFVASAQNDTIKVLAIGNSFSEDAVEEHLSGLLRAEGLRTVFVNTVANSCGLACLGVNEHYV